VTSASQAPASSTRNDLAARLSALRAAADLAVPDPEISHLAALEDWLSDDPASYFRWIKGVARERLQAEVSESVLRAAIDDLSRDLRDGTIAGFVCGEALQVCLADLTMLEELEETEVPESAVASLRRDLRPASIDLVHRLMRNLALRDTPAPDEAAPRPGGWPAVPLSEWSDWPTSEQASLDMDRPVLLVPTAGRGTRLRSTIPKGLVPLDGVPMIEYVVRAARRSGVQQFVSVLKYGADTQRDYLGRYGQVVVQTAAEGNGHSIYAGLTALSGWRAPIFVAYSDCPFLTTDLFGQLAERPAGDHEAFRLSVYAPARPSAGRVILAPAGEVLQVEQPRVTHTSVPEADGGLYLVWHERFYRSLGAIANDNPRREYQLTDVVPKLRAAGWTATAVRGPAEDFQSVDTPADLLMAKLRLATGAQTPAQLADPALVPRILSFMSSYGLRLPSGESSGNSGMAERLQDIAEATIASARTLVGPVLDLASGA
jgi:CTP:molybdopterin cytidylyltransferase MocA